jgi:hypothetical protein
MAVVVVGRSDDQSQYTQLNVYLASGLVPVLNDTKARIAIHWVTKSAAFTRGY